MRFLAGLCALLVPAVAAAGVQSACVDLSAERDGVTCKVSYLDEQGDTLLIRLHPKSDDSPGRVAASKSATRRAIRIFFDYGGTHIRIRTTGADGLPVERACTRVKGRKTEKCGAWVPVEG